MRSRIEIMERMRAPLTTSRGRMLAWSPVRIPAWQSSPAAPHAPHPGALGKNADELVALEHAYDPDIVGRHRPPRVGPRGRALAGKEEAGAQDVANLLHGRTSFTPRRRQARERAGIATAEPPAGPLGRQRVAVQAQEA